MKLSQFVHADPEALSKVEESLGIYRGEEAAKRLLGNRKFPRIPKTVDDLTYGQEMVLRDLKKYETITVPGSPKQIPNVYPQGDFPKNRAGYWSASSICAMVLGGWVDIELHELGKASQLKELFQGVTRGSKTWYKLSVSQKALALWEAQRKEEARLKRQENRLFNHPPKMEGSIPKVRYLYGKFPKAMWPYRDSSLYEDRASYLAGFYWLPHNSGGSYIAASQGHLITVKHLPDIKHPGDSYKEKILAGKITELGGYRGEVIQGFGKWQPWLRKEITEEVLLGADTLPFTIAHKLDPHVQPQNRVNAAIAQVDAKALLKLLPEKDYPDRSMAYLVWDGSVFYIWFWCSETGLSQAWSVQGADGSDDRVWASISLKYLRHILKQATKDSALYIGISPPKAPEQWLYGDSHKMAAHADDMSLETVHFWHLFPDHRRAVEWILMPTLPPGREHTKSKPVSQPIEGEPIRDPTFFSPWDLL